MAITTTEQTAIMKTVSALFNKAFTPETTTKFFNFYEANGKSLSALADGLIGSASYTSLYAGAGTPAEFGAILMAKYNMTYGGTSDADTKMTAFVDYSFAHAADNNSLRTIQAVDKYIVATLLPSVTTGNVFETMNTAIANKAEVAITFKNDPANAGKELNLSTVTADPATKDGVITGQTFTLTTGVDTMPGLIGSKGTDSTDGNDTINAIVDAGTPANSTLTALDTINGGKGIDTLNILATAALTLPTGITVTDVETANFRAGTTVVANTTTWTGLTTANVTQATDATVTAAATTTVNVSGATGVITVDGGKNVSVADATAAKNIAIGATTVNAGTITVTDTNQTSGTIIVDGGTDVTITSTGANTGVITVGQGGAATDLPTGAVTIVDNYTNVAAAATNLTGGNISVTGGSTISVTQTAAQGVMATASTNSKIVQGNVTIVGSTATTSVAVKQDAAVAAVNTVLAVAGNTEVQTVTFGAMTTGQTLIINNLTFTAAKNLTAAEVAAAFSNLTASDTQGCANTTNGVFTNLSSTLAMTSGAVTTTSTASTVTFTSTTSTPLATLTIAGTAAGTSVTNEVNGVAAVTATGRGGVDTGVVLIDDNTTAASITTISVDGYAAASKIGNTTATTVLSSLTLANAAGTVDMVVADTAATLALAVNGNMGTSTDGQEAVLTFTAAPTTLNVTATGNNYIDLTAAATKTLSVAGTGLLNIADIDLTALETVTVTGSASLVLAAATSNTVTSITTTGTTGAVTATIDGAVGTYTGGAGADTVTLATSTALTKAIDLGAGDDTLSFAALGVTGSTALLSGGTGTNTLAMSVATADALDAATQTFYTNFQRLTLNDAAGDDDNSADTVTLDLEKLGFQSYVTSNGTVVDTTTPGSSDILALTNMASGGTLAIVAAAAGVNTQHTVTVKDAALVANTTDSLNILVSTAAALNAGKVTAANVETINITVTDTDTTAHSDDLILTAANATAVTVAGNASLALVMTGSTAVTSINASTMTGGLTVTSLNTTAATTITGGEGNDVLTAATGTTADILIGGAGNDTLTSNKGMNTLTGGAGNDIFVITAGQLTSSSYATITDFTAGDSIKFAGADSFKAAAITQGDTAVFQDYVNAAVNATGANDLSWFQYAGNTYIVMDVATTDSTSFINGEDAIVKLTGLVDLSTASFNDTSDTIQIC
ncbi:MAG: hypothetical protein PHS42_05880 [Sulfurimonas sp.]|nr:hypothetical protein [Sulfurimonas sp.]